MLTSRRSRSPGAPAGRNGSARRWVVAAIVVTVIGLLGAALLVREQDEGSAPTVDTPDGLYAGDGELPPDRWRSLPPSPLSPRAYPTLVWTGGDLIVFGGIGGVTFTDGAVFDTAARTWDRIDPPSRPEGFLPRAVATDGDRLVVLYQEPAVCDPEVVLEGSPGAIYDHEAGAWEPLPPAPGAMECAAEAVWVDGDLYVWFWGDTGTEGMAFDPDTATWRGVAPVPFDEFVLTLVAPDELLAVRATSSLSTGDRPLASYDAATDAWTTESATGLPWTMRIDAMGLGAGEPLVGTLLVGESDDASAGYQLWRAIDIGPPVETESTALPAPPDADVSSGVMAGCGGQVVRWGGRVVTGMDSSYLPPAEGFTYDSTPPVEDRAWFAIADGPLAPRSFAGWVCGDGVLYIWGGEGESDPSSNPVPLSDGAEYRPPRAFAERQEQDAN